MNRPVDVLQTGTYFLEKRAQVLEADGDLASINDIDRFQTVMHLWEFEASFASSRQKAIEAYMDTYCHAVDWGLEDMFMEKSPEVGTMPACMRYGGQTTSIQEGDLGTKKNPAKPGAKIPSEFDLQPLWFPRISLSRATPPAAEIISSFDWHPPSLSAIVPISNLIPQNWLLGECLADN